MIRVPRLRRRPLALPDAAVARALDARRSWLRGPWRPAGGRDGSHLVAVTPASATVIPVRRDDPAGPGADDVRR